MVTSWASFENQLLSSGQLRKEFLDIHKHILSKCIEIKAHGPWMFHRQYANTGDDSLTVATLASWCKQIAEAMEYLEVKRVWNFWMPILKTEMQSFFILCTFR